MSRPRIIGALLTKFINKPISIMGTILSVMLCLVYNSTVFMCSSILMGCTFKQLNPFSVICMKKCEPHSFPASNHIGLNYIKAILRIIIHKDLGIFCT